MPLTEAYAQYFRQKAESARMAKQQQPQRGGKPAGQQVDPALERQLREMRERWNRSKQESKKNFAGGTTCKPGRHLARLSDARMGAGDNGPFLKLEFTVIEGDDQGEKAVRFHNTNTDERMTNLQRDLRRLGVDNVDSIEDPAELVGIAAELVARAPTVKITVKENGEYLNMYIDKLVDMQDEGASAPAAAARPAPARGAAGRPVPGPAGRSQPARPAPAAPAAAKRPSPPPPPPEDEISEEEEPAGDETEETAGEEVVEEEVVEEEVVEEPAEAFEVGNSVQYVSKGVKRTGKIHKVVDDDNLHVRDDETQKLVAVSVTKNNVTAIIETEEEEPAEEA